MVNYNRDRLNTTFSALADPTRRAILTRLARGESTVTALARPFKMSLPAISKHLRVLETAGLLSRERDGRIHRCRLNAKPMQDADDWIRRYSRFWEKRLDALAEYLETTRDEEEGGGGRGEETQWPEDKPPAKPRSPSNGRSRSRGKGFSGRGRNRKR
jgi:DNA-binding transcriptional ArsR family regulator